MSKNVSYKGPSPDEQPHVTDSYFKKTRKIILENGDVEVTYAVFMRRPVLFCPRLAISWLKDVQKARNTKFKIKLFHNEGAWVGAGEPLMYISGSFSKLVELETIYLQLIGPASVAAYNAFIMCSEMPETKFLAKSIPSRAGKPPPTTIPNFRELPSIWTANCRNLPNHILRFSDSSGLKRLPPSATICGSLIDTRLSLST